MFSFIKCYAQIIMAWISLFKNKWEQKHRAPNTYINNDYAMQMLQSLWAYQKTESRDPSETL